MDEYRLKNQGHTTFTDRQQHAAEAKKKLLEKFKTAPKMDDEALVALRAKREATARAREERRLERERLKLEKQARKAAEAEAELAAAAAEAEAEALRLAAEEKRLADEAVEQAAAMKAERDRRYAARKARSR